MDASYSTDHPLHELVNQSERGNFGSPERQTMVSPILPPELSGPTQPLYVERTERVSKLNVNFLADLAALEISWTESEDGKGLELVGTPDALWLIIRKWVAVRHERDRIDGMLDMMLAMCGALFLLFALLTMWS